MFFKILINIVLFLNFIFFTNVEASDVCSGPFTFRDVYQKPTLMAALDWMQVLEDERDKADSAGNFDVFKRTTDEISATIAGKYGLAERLATPEEQLIIIHSITRTRHRFMGQRNMLYDRYLGHDRTATAALLQTDSRFTDHMAAVLAIDIMVRKALNDDDFHEQWDQSIQTKTVSAEFTPSVISHAQTYEKKEVYEALKQPLQDFLQHRQDTIGLANDVFNVFAPKMTLTRFYHEVIPSGGTYKGWTVHKADAFANLITLTAEEKVSYPQLESTLKPKINEEIPNSHDDIFSTSQRAYTPNLNIYDELSFSEENVIVEYTFSLERKYIFGSLTGREERSFFLSRLAKPSLKPILNKTFGTVPKKKIFDTYRKWEEVSFSLRLKEKLGVWIIDCKERALFPLVSIGHPNSLFNYSVILFNGENGVEMDADKSIYYCREAVNLGCELAIKQLGILFTNYARMLFLGTDGVKKDMAKGLEISREAISLGDEVAKRNHSIYLNNYARMLFLGTGEVKKDMCKSIALCREALCFEGREYEVAKINLPLFLYDYGVTLFEGKDDIIRDIPAAIEIVKEAVKLGSKNAKINLPILLNNYAVMLLYGQDGISQDVSKGAQIMREAADLGNEGSRKNLDFIRSGRIETF